MSSLTISRVVPESIIHAVHLSARGKYQNDLLSGREAWSGRTLRGKARVWSGRYSASREHLIDRVQHAVSKVDQSWFPEIRKVLFQGRVTNRLTLIRASDDLMIDWVTGKEVPHGWVVIISGDITAYTWLPWRSGTLESFDWLDDPARVGSPVCHSLRSARRQARQVFSMFDEQLRVDVVRSWFNVKPSAPVYTLLSETPMEQLVLAFGGDNAKV